MQYNNTLNLFIGLVIVAGLLLSACPAYDEDRPVTPQPRQAVDIEAIINGMTLEEKVGQMFMISIPGTTLTARGQSFIQTWRPGAVVLFGSNTQDQNPAQVAALTNSMQMAQTGVSDIPLIIAVDQEGGRIQRLTEGFTYFPDPLGLGATTDPIDIQQVAAAQGRELQAVGINMNLAPVADLHTREDMLQATSVMHRRTFGANPERVGQQVVAYMQGLQMSGIIGVVKHFPGHGGAADSHLVLPVIATDQETAFQTTFRPFQIAIEGGVPAIMTGHLYYRNIEPEPDLPVTLSSYMMQLLRENYGFTGVIISDAMDMQAITQNYTIPEASVIAIKAGVDMLAMGLRASNDVQQASIQAVIDAVRAGEISEERINASVRRLLLLKSRYNIFDWQPVSAPQLTGSTTVLESVFQRSVTVVRDDEHLLPLSPDQSVALIYPAVYAQMGQRCQGLLPGALTYGFQMPPTTADRTQIAQIQADTYVIFVEDALIRPAQRVLVEALPPQRTVVVALDLPYDLEVMQAVSTYVALYTSFRESRLAVCPILTGQLSPKGTLPISIGRYPEGHGLALDCQRWERYEASALQLNGSWQQAESQQASGLGYLFTDDPDASAMLSINGYQVIIHYLHQNNAGHFAVYADDSLFAEVNADTPESGFRSTVPFKLSPGAYTLRIEPASQAGHTDSESGGQTLGIDAIDVCVQ